ncbi:MAG TPA: GNAT family N-acetyltransferase [Gemmatimonadaceae bacterium]|jgi:RimJ/RimL family protein N-acetyltransferase
MTQLTIPELETPRLVMRAFRQSDFEAYAAMMSDPDVTRYLGPGDPLNRIDAWRQLAMFAGHWQLKGFGLWAVEERSTGQFIGRIGCFEPEGWPAFEIGYTLARHAWRKGYASEGAAAALDYARNVLQREEITSVIMTGNVGSVAVATKLGATLGETVQFYHSTALIYRYPRVTGAGSE